MKSKHIYVADFETSTQAWLERDNGCARVWLWDICTVNDEYKHKSGRTITEFMRTIASRKMGDSKTVFFHNLRFDGMYILFWLQTRGFVWKQNGKDLKKQEYSTLISGEGIFYSIKVCFGEHGKNKNTVTFLDSLKKFPQGVRTLAKAYNLPILKGDIDYDEYREIGHYPTPEELSYIHNDTEIVARALRTKLDNGLDRMTRASDALKDFIESIGGKDVMREIYPVLDDETDGNIRKAYKGGYVYVCEDYKNVYLHDVTSYDVNSLFPSVMRYEKLPYGVPVEFDGEYVEDKSYPLYIQYMTCNFELKDGCLPTIQIKGCGRFIEAEYLKSSNGERVFLALTSLDLKLFKERYTITDVQYIGGYKFKAMRGIFDKYIDKWVKAKIENNDNPALRQNAKDMLNSLYGKFARRISQKSKMPVLNENMEVTFETYEDEENEPLYTALACFVTAYARYKTMSTAQRFYEAGSFIYSDTDSVHALGSQPEWLDVDKTRLGAWKNEGTAEDARFLRPKTYIKRKHGEICVTCAGMPDNIKSIATFDNFRYGQVFGGKLVQHAVKGGCVLVDTNFSIKVE